MRTLRKCHGAVWLLLSVLPASTPHIAHAQAKQPAKQAPRQSSAQARAEREAEAALRASVARFRARVEAMLAGKPLAEDAKRLEAIRLSPVPTAESPQQSTAQAAVAAPAPGSPGQPQAISKGHWALLVADAATGSVLYEWNADKYFTPASNTKMFTTALAMARLGPDFRWRTTIETRAAVDKYGRLLGDLVLVGRGDPNLSNRKFPFEKEVERDGPPEKILAALADQIVARGIRQIEGDVVGDDSYFQDSRYPSGWAIDDLTAGYGAPVSALCVNDNAVFVEYRPGDYEGSPAWFGVEPWAEFYTFRNEMRTAAAGSRRRVWAEREPGSREVTLRGNVPLGEEPRSFTLAVEEPAEFAAALLKRLLEAHGVRVYGAARGQHVQPMQTAVMPTVLAEHQSVTLSEAVKLINKISQNLHTEILLRTVAREIGGVGSTDRGRELAQEFFASIGIAEGDVAIQDGSGLSRMNLITPRAAVTLLRWVAQQPWADAYFASLPVSGQDGTLDSRMKDSPAAGRIHAKTGTLANSNGLSGFADTLHGRRLVFSMFGNLHNLRGATALMDAICIAMVEEIGKPAVRKKK